MKKTMAGVTAIVLLLTVCATSLMNASTAYAALNFDPSVLTTKEYYLDSGEKLLLGDYSDKDPTALSMGLNIAASVTNVDLGMDIRDLVYDVQHYGSDDVKLSSLAIDAVAVLPVIGLVKYIKHVDTIADAVDTASDIAKNTDTAIDVADNVHDAAKAADLVDDVVDTAKDIEIIPFEELPEKVQETYEIYVDYGWDAEKALDNMAEGSDAGREYRNISEALPKYDTDGNELTYIEYDAYSKGDDPNFLNPWARGSGRLVRDNLGNVYFTEDHYETFQLIA